nr:SPOR domain-containing protein [Desulfobacter latus]
MFEKGVALMKNDQYQEAVAVFTRFIELAPENPAAYKNRGVAYMKMGKYDLAIHDFEKTRQIKPNLKGLYSNLGVAWYYKGDFDQAIKNYNMEIALTPDNYYTFFNRAICRAELDQLSESLADVNRTLALFPEFYLAHCFRGDILAKMGKTTLAREAYQRALEIDPAHGYAKEKIAGLPPEEEKQEEKIMAEAPEETEAAVAKEIREPPVEKSSAETESVSKTVQTLAGDSETTPAYELQAGAFQLEKNAQALAKRLQDKGIAVRRFELTRPSGKIWILVRTGAFETRAGAEAARARAMEKSGLEFIVRPYGAF